MAFDWIESVSSSKQIAYTATLPPTSALYGSYQIVDNTPPIIQRSFTSENVTRSELNNIVEQTLVRYRTFQLTTSTGASYTGRYISLSAQQTPGADNYTLTLVLQDLTTEDNNNSKAKYTIA